MNNHEYSLAETMLGIDDRLKEDLGPATATLTTAMDDVLNGFYAKVRQTPQLAGFFSSPERMLAAQGAQKKHWARIFQGEFGPEFVNSVKRIGAAHHKIGLHPDIYMAGYGMALPALLDRLVRSNLRGGLVTKSRLERLARQQSSLIRAIFYDILLSLSVYLDEAENAKTSALREMADKVEAETIVAVNSIAEKAQSMDGNAQKMALSAKAVGSDAQSVSAAIVQVVSSVETVSSATEELTASIHEISSQISKSSQLTNEAVQTSEDCRKTISQLANAVDAIGVVINIITDIASQTNLLALNATIEAARAGEAGKGFAVVAHEVKMLANQTAKSTEEITGRIKEVQAISGRAVESVSKVIGSIGTIDEVSSIVAAAANEQAAATQEIARTVAETAAAAGEVSRRVTSVSQEAINVGDISADVGQLANQVSDAIVDLRYVVDQVIRTATPEVDRRHDLRLPARKPAKVTFAGDTAAAAGTLREITPRGARVDGLPKHAPHEACSIEVGDRTIPAQVQNVRRDATQMVFQEDHEGDFEQIAL